VVIASDLRDGMAVRIEGQVFKVLEVEVKAGGGQLGGVVKTKLRNVSSGRFWEPHFRPDERLEDLELERQTMEFIYGDPDNCVFMNQNTYEQVEVPRAVVGSLEKFLEPGVRAGVEFFDGQPISIELPPVIEARVAETAPPIHSGQDGPPRVVAAMASRKVRRERIGDPPSQTSQNQKQWVSTLPRRSQQLIA